MISSLDSLDVKELKLKPHIHDELHFLEAKKDQSTFAKELVGEACYIADHLAVVPKPIQSLSAKLALR